MLSFNTKALLANAISTMNRRVVASITVVLAAVTVHAQQVTIGNNLLYDAALTPNLRIGTKLSTHWSAGITAGYRPWPTDDNTSKKWRHLLLSPDVRYWTDSVNVHHFFGANLIYSHYNAAELHFPFGMYPEVRNQRLQGDLGTLGVFYGYSWPLGRHWNIEAAIGVAVGYTQYERYKCGLCGTKLGKSKKIFAMPEAAVSIVYNLPGRPRQTAPVVPEITLPTLPTDTLPATVPTDTVPPTDTIANKAAGVEPAVTPTTRPARRVERRDQMLSVHFPVNRHVVLEDFADNRTTLADIINITLVATTDTLCRLKKIEIVGLASVEGGLWRNQLLADRRAKALKDYIKQRVDVPDSLIEVTGGGEAWSDLAAHVAELKAGYEQKAQDDAQTPWFKRHYAGLAEQMQQALDIMNSEHDAARREQRLRALNGGRTWREIRRAFPEHRNAGFVRICYETVY